MAQNNLPSNSEFRNLLHALDLVAKQIRTGRVEADYAIRQIDKVSNKLKDLAQEQESAKSAGRFEALYQVSRILGTSLDLQTVLDQVMDAVIQLTGAERGFLMLNNDDGVLKIKAARNYDQETLSDTKKGYSRTVANIVMDSGNAMLTTDAQADPRLKEQQSVMTQSFRSIMAAPLIARGRVIGVAYVENSFVAGLFSPQDLETLEALAGQASVAIDNAILFEETDE
ncbi:MAG: GAF domain-containing protein, partial [Chloroflexota bacterium]